jgi:hypothetical protein|tara:strand:- start:123 stop:368 length:246 start_codon:yes stop_codon:yes gene_type:complete
MSYIQKLPEGVFVKMPSTEFSVWSRQELINEIIRLREIEENKRLREIRIDYETVVLSCDEEEEEEEDTKVQTIEQLRCHSC